MEDSERYGIVSHGFYLFRRHECYSFHLTHDSQFAQGHSVHPARHIFIPRQTLTTLILKQTQGEHSMSGLAGQPPVGQAPGAPAVGSGLLYRGLWPPPRSL